MKKICSFETFRIDVQERQLLNNALSLIKSIINSVNAQIDEYAKCQRLTDILNRLDQKSSTIFRGSKFKVGLL